MFKDIKNCLNEFETTFQNVNKKFGCNSDEADILEYFDLNLAKAIMKNTYIDSDWHLELED